LLNTTTIAATAAEKQALVDGLTNHTETRASVLRKVVDGTVVINEGNVQFTTTYGQAFINQETRRVFVFMEYVGYLRRNPDPAGFIFWLGKLNFYNGDPFQAEMVRSFYPVARVSLTFRTTVTWERRHPACMTTHRRERRVFPRESCRQGCLRSNRQSALLSSWQGLCFEPTCPPRAAGAQVPFLNCAS
jgi:hypothetical protein